METKEAIKKKVQEPSCVYLLGMVGAAIYFISHATSFGMGVLGFLKAVVWPVFLVYEAFKHLAL
jgi:hypothetical protein